MTPANVKIDDAKDSSVTLTLPLHAQYDAMRL